MPQRVLVIDDSHDIHELLDVRLRPEGVVLEHAFDAEQGLAMVAQAPPDLVLLDVSLPTMTGFELCRVLKSEMTTASVPVIFLTGASDVHDKVEGLDLGAVDYVTKPFEPTELRARVRAALRLKRYHDLLAARCHVDGLTGVWNRSYFDLRIGEEVAAAQRYGRVVSLVLIDLDDFKSCNDRYGHPFGDQVLQRVGEVLGHGLRATDAPCRFGGEEFAVLMTQTPLEGAMGTAERIRRQIGELRFQPKGQPVRVSGSFGVSCTEYLEGPPSASRLIAAADAALYTAKSRGKDQVQTAPGWRATGT